MAFFTVSVPSFRLFFISERINKTNLFTKNSGRTIIKFWAWAAASYFLLSYLSNFRLLLFIRVSLVLTWENLTIYQNILYCSISISCFVLEYFIICFRIVADGHHCPPSYRLSDLSDNDPRVSGRGENILYQIYSFFKHLEYNSNNVGVSQIIINI